MKNSLLLNALVLGLVGLGCQTLRDSEAARAAAAEDEDDQEISLSEVPQAAKDAALAAVPGLVLSEAEKESEDGVTTYCLEGEANGAEYEIEVTADGRVIEVESEDDDDDEDEDEESDD